MAVDWGTFGTLAKESIFFVGRTAEYAYHSARQHALNKTKAKVVRKSPLWYC